jgi:hypothetical protein
MDTIKEKEWIILFHETVERLCYVSNYLEICCPICFNMCEIFLETSYKQDWVAPTWPYCFTCNKTYVLRIGTVTSNNTKRTPQEICQENKLRDKCIQCGRDLKQHPSFSSRYMYCGDCCD